jgi:hypothetical protein
MLLSIMDRKSGVSSWPCTSDKPEEWVMQKISVPSRLWYENQERELNFPDRWEVHNMDSPGFRKPGLTSLEIKEKIDHPL